MSVSFTVGAELRTDLGKGASRRLRRANRVPAVVYGGDAEPQSIMIDQNEVLKHLDHQAFYSHILTLNIGEESQQVILRDVQRHPYKCLILHMDFLRIKSDHSIQVHVPLRFINEDICIAVKQGGGVINHIETEVFIECLPANLPEYIEVDVSTLELGSSLHLSELVLPDGASSIDLAHGEDHDRAVVSVHAVRGPKSADEETETGDEGASTPLS